MTFPINGYAFFLRLCEIEGTQLIGTFTQESEIDSWPLLGSDEYLGRAEPLTGYTAQLYVLCGLGKLPTLAL